MTDQPTTKASETGRIDPYEAVLTDLHAKRDQIDQAIAAIESLRGTPSGMQQRPMSAAEKVGTKPAHGGDAGGPGALLGMSIAEAAKKLLATKRTTLKNTELATLFKAGGLMLNSKDWVNTIGAVLTRRANDVGDIVKVERGTWGLKEWYPNRNFKKDAAKPDAPKEEAAETPKKKGGLFSRNPPTDETTETEAP